MQGVSAIVGGIHIRQLVNVISVEEPLTEFFNQPTFLVRKIYPGMEVSQSDQRFKVWLVGTALCDFVICIFMVAMVCFSTHQKQLQKLNVAEDIQTEDTVPEHEDRSQKVKYPHY